MAHDELILTKLEAGVLWLTLNNPGNRNALSSMMIASITNELNAAYLDDQAKVIVITGKGPVFSAGHDLRELDQHAGNADGEAKQKVTEILENCAAMMMGITQAPKPVIACVQGTASAAGCQLVSACDLAIADSSAMFCTPGVNIGVFCTTPLVGIGRNVSRKHAMEMALTGDMFSAEEAVRFGLINRHVAAEALMARTQELASKVAQRSAQSIRDGKAAFYAQIEMPLSEAFKHANTVMCDAVTTTSDAEEGRAAFFEKRKPVWTRN